MPVDYITINFLIRRRFFLLYIRLLLTDDGDQVHEHTEIKKKKGIYQFSNIRMRDRVNNSM